MTTHIQPTTDEYLVEPIAISVAATCQATSLGRSTVLELLYAGTIRSRRVGARRVVSVASLREFIDGGGDADGAA